LAYTHFDRLSALDASFLEIEDQNTHMHVGAVAVLEAGPLAQPDGSLAFERIEQEVEATLHRMPRYRQRLAHVPLTGAPVWVDDPRFNLHYHLRHTSLPAPGDERQLKRLAGRILSQQLDRGKPLWETWVVEGLEGGRFAVVTKAHHCMIDGVGSAELMAAAMERSPDSTPREVQRWVPRPAPGAVDLLLGEGLRRAGEGVAAVRAAARAVVSPFEAIGALREAATDTARALGAGLRPASPTPLNVPIGPHRRFDWLRTDFHHVREVKDVLGGTVNDVVLAVAAGALRRFLRHRGEAVEDLDFRALVPVNTRTAADRRRPGNRVSMMVARLALEAATPRERLERTIGITKELKASGQSRGIEVLEELGDWTSARLFTEFARLTARSRPFNVTITNVPGPPFRVFFCGAPLRAVYPLVPLYRNQALGIALFSYDGGLYWGFNADWDALPDLHELVESVAYEFEALHKAATDAAPVESP
jgi:WS/DGAT/MGAT family acyltransferase